MVYGIHGKNPLDILTRMWELLGGCLTVKNLWGLSAGEDGVGLLFYTKLIVSK